MSSHLFTLESARQHQTNLQSVEEPLMQTIDSRGSYKIQKVNKQVERSHQGHSSNLALRVREMSFQSQCVNRHYQVMYTHRTAP